MAFRIFDENQPIFAVDVIGKIAFLRREPSEPGYLTARHIRSVDANRASTTLLTPKPDPKTGEPLFDSLWPKAGGIINIAEIELVCDNLDEANRILRHRRSNSASV